MRGEAREFEARAVDETAPGTRQAGTPQSGTPPAEGWRAWLSGGSPREVLARIVQGDPLRLRARVARALREGAYLFDADRVHLRSLARCARAAPRYRGRPELDVWLDGHVAEALADHLREDDERLRRGATPHGSDAVPARDAAPAGNGADAILTSADELSGALVELSRPLGLDPRALAFACHAFNRLPDEDRRAFFQLVLEGRTLDELAREDPGGATAVARRARRALCTLLASDTHPVPLAEPAPAGALGPASQGDTAEPEGRAS